MGDKRGEPRTPTRCGVNLWVVDTESDKTDDLKSEATVVDVSAKGFGIQIPHKPDKGSLVCIDRSVGDQVPRFGVVMWTIEEQGYYRVGCLRPFHYMLKNRS